MGGNIASSMYYATSKAEDISIAIRSDVRQYHERWDDNFHHLLHQVPELEEFLSSEGKLCRKEMHTILGALLKQSALDPRVAGEMQCALQRNFYKVTEHHVGRHLKKMSDDWSRLVDCVEKYAMILPLTVVMVGFLYSTKKMPSGFFSFKSDQHRNKLFLRATVLSFATALPLAPTMPDEFKKVSFGWKVRPLSKASKLFMSYQDEDGRVQVDYTDLIGKSVLEALGDHDINVMCIFGAEKAGKSTTLDLLLGALGFGIGHTGQGHTRGIVCGVGYDEERNRNIVVLDSEGFMGYNQTNDQLVAVLLMLQSQASIFIVGNNTKEHDLDTIRKIIQNARGSGTKDMSSGKIFQSLHILIRDAPDELVADDEYQKLGSDIIDAFHTISVIPLPGARLGGASSTAAAGQQVNSRSDDGLGRGILVEPLYGNFLRNIGKLSSAIRTDFEEPATVLGTDRKLTGPLLAQLFMDASQKLCNYQSTYSAAESTFQRYLTKSFAEFDAGKLSVADVLTGLGGASADPTSTKHTLTEVLSKYCDHHVDRFVQRGGMTTAAERSFLLKKCLEAKQSWWETAATDDRTTALFKEASELSDALKVKWKRHGEDFSVRLIDSSSSVSPSANDKVLVHDVTRLRENLEKDMVQLNVDLSALALKLGLDPAKYFSPDYWKKLQIDVVSECAKAPREKAQPWFSKDTKPQTIYLGYSQCSCWWGTCKRKPSCYVTYTVNHPRSVDASAIFLKRETLYLPQLKDDGRWWFYDLLNGKWVCA